MSVIEEYGQLSFLGLIAVWQANEDISEGAAGGAIRKDCYIPKNRIASIDRSNRTLDLILQNVNHQNISDTPCEPVLSSGSRTWALVSALCSPLWVPAKAIVSACWSFFNIVTAGSLSIATDKAPEGLFGRIKAMGCSVASVLLVPISMIVEEVAVITHVFKPEVNYADLFARHMWTGFVYAKFEEFKPLPPKS
jgi:hypothetical protein